MRKGVYTAIITPFAENGFGINESAFRKLIERQIEAGVHGIVVAGSTGEGQTMSEKEWIHAVEIAADYRSKIEVMVSCGHSSTWQTAERAKLAASLGAQSLLISSPPYNKPTQDGILRHFEEITRQCSSLPIMVYNIPGRTAVNIAAATLAKLWEIESIHAVKESSGNWSQFLQMRTELPENKHIFSGDDPLNLSFFSHGAAGSVSVLSNLAPDYVVRLWTLCQEGKYTEAQKHFFKSQRLIDYLFSESNPIPIKWAVGQLLGMDLNPRLPLTPLSSNHQKPLSDEIKSFLQA